ncbi:MAG: site-2 protease family protein, partial [Opitutae bacterium]
INTDEKTTVEGPAFTAGLLSGDIVQKIDGKPVSNFMEIQHGIVTGAGRDKEGNPKANFTVKRGDEVLDIEVFPKLTLINEKSGDKIRQIGIVPASQTIHTLVENSAAEKAGLKIDDRIISINGKASYSTMTLRDALEENGFKPITLGIERDGKPMELQMEPMHAAEKKTTVAIEIPLRPDPVTLHFLPKYSEPQTNLPEVDAEANLLLYDITGEFPEDHQFQPYIGDTLDEIASIKISNLNQVTKAFELSPLPDPTILTLISKDTSKSLKLPLDSTLTVTPTNIRPLLGLATGGTTYINLDPFTQIRLHIRTTIQVLTALLDCRSDIGIQQLSGPIGIGRVFHKYANIDFRLVMVFAVLLNINLAILNLLPIPVLDGGHILFATIAKVRENGLPIQLIVRIQTGFVLLLFSMMIYVGVFDSLRWMGDNDAEHNYEIRKEIFFANTIIINPPEAPPTPAPETE